MGRHLRDIGKIDEAIDEFRKSIHLDHENAVIYYELGDIFYQRNELQDSMQMFTTALEYKKTTLMYIRSLVQSMLPLKNGEKPKNCLKKLLSLRLIITRSTKNLERLAKTSMIPKGP